MTKAEFNNATLSWAKNLLSQPAYTMPNGKSSHAVAQAEIAKAMDKMLDDNSVRVRADGSLEFCA